MLGNNQRKGAFSDVEQIKGSKARYKKDNELYISSVNKISFDQSAKILNQ